MRERYRLAIAAQQTARIHVHQLQHLRIELELQRHREDIVPAASITATWKVLPTVWVELAGTTVRFTGGPAAAWAAARRRSAHRCTPGTRTPDVPAVDG